MARKATQKQKYPQPISNEGQKSIKLKFRPQPKTEAQKFYLDSLSSSALTIGMGPAGSGKSFLAMAAALDKLISKEVDRIVLTRPIVEAGERLGFLPGSFAEKIHPYLLPLLDAITDLVGPSMAEKLLESGKIEFAPLAYMRGRSFSNAYVILDEAQNATIEQMKMFITRIGEHSQFVVNGDESQSDLGYSVENGLTWISKRLRGVSPEIQVIQFENCDIQRSKIVQIILNHLDDPVAPSSRNRHSFYADENVIRRN